MRLDFRAEVDPGDTELREVAALAPWNAFYTTAFGRASRAAGLRPCVLGLTADDRLVSACTAFLQSGRLRRRLIVQSLPELPDPDVFWTGLQRLCRRLRVSEVEINSFGSRSAQVPRLGHEQWRKARIEYVLDLTECDLESRYSTNHLRNIRRARKAGVTVACSTDHAAIATHAELIRMSMRRRVDRGEPVTDGDVGRSVALYVESGAGVLFQARRDDTVVSSILVLLAPLGGYYHSAGSSPAGMESGASHLLVSHVIAHLRTQGAGEFVLGGAGINEEGLARFKAGFGAARRQLEATGFFLGSVLQRSIIAAWAYLGTRMTS